jgi:hypothetical protein
VPDEIEARTLFLFKGPSVRISDILNSSPIGYPDLWKTSTSIGIVGLRSSQVQRLRQTWFTASCCPREWACIWINRL